MTISPQPVAANAADTRPARSTPTRRARARQPRHRWLYRIAANRAHDAWQHDQRATWDQAIRAYHHELAARGEHTKHADVLAGWWTGPPPYGYRRITQRTRDHRGQLRTRHLLSLDEHRAPVVPTIYGWYVTDRLPPEQIAHRLAAAPDRYPLPLNHTTGKPRAWTAAVVRGILTNPAYTGYVVRGRTRGGVRQAIRHWTWSIGPSHPALISAAQFRAVHNRAVSARPKHARNAAAQRRGHHAAG